ATTLAEFLPILSEMRLKGLSGTLPHKEAILPHLDGLDETARRVGAVNTVIKVWNRLEGRNTDVEAGLVPLRRRMTLRGARVAVMGAGGRAPRPGAGPSAGGGAGDVVHPTRGCRRGLGRAL